MQGKLRASPWIKQRRGSNEITAPLNAWLLTSNLPPGPHALLPDVQAWEAVLSSKATFHAAEMLRTGKLMHSLCCTSSSVRREACCLAGAGAAV